MERAHIIEAGKDAAYSAAELALSALEWVVSPLTGRPRIGSAQWVELYEGDGPVLTGEDAIRFREQLSAVENFAAADPEGYRRSVAELSTRQGRKQHEEMLARYRDDQDTTES